MFYSCLQTLKHNVLEASDKKIFYLRYLNIVSLLLLCHGDGDDAGDDQDELDHVDACGDVELVDSVGRLDAVSEYELHYIVKTSEFPRGKIFLVSGTAVRSSLSTLHSPLVYILTFNIQQLQP